jgi:hypothetical protein
MAIGIEIGLPFRRGGVNIPFQSDLLLDYFERQGSNLADSKENKIGKILPACASFNGVDQYVFTSGVSPQVTGGTPIDIEIWFKTNSASTSQYLINCGGSGASFKGFSLRIDTSGNLIFSSSIGDGTLIANQTIASINATTFYRLVLEWNGQTGGPLSWSINGVTGSGTTTKGWSGLSDTLLCVGARKNSGTPTPTSFTQPFNGYIGYAKVVFSTVNYELILSGKGKYAYSPNGNYAVGYMNGLTVSTATLGGSTVYNEIGSIYPMDYGYKIYKKTGEPDEYVPQGGKVSHLTDYTTTTKDTFTGNTKAINMWPCYVDFDYTDEGGASLAIFDRSNTTRCTDFARGALYDAINPYRWFISEIADPRVYFDYFNDGYAGMMFGKVETELYESAYYIKELNRLLGYATDKKGNDQYKVMIYCKINVFAL